jgi:hypothetical protein
LTGDDNAATPTGISISGTASFAALTIIFPETTSRSVTGCASTIRNVPRSRSVAVRSKLTAKISSGYRNNTTNAASNWPFDTASGCSI